MQDKELLEQLKAKQAYQDAENAEYYYTQEEHAAILSLLSQQSTVSQTDEDALRKYMTEEARIPDEKWFAIERLTVTNAWNAATQHVRQQLSQQQGIRWVKASERLPDEITAKTIIRHVKLKGIVEPDWFIQCKDLPGFDGLQNYEWLDESTLTN